MDEFAYDIEYLRLQVLVNEDEGLGKWEMYFDVMREDYMLDECHRLLAAAKGWDLTQEGRARVREEEALLAIHVHDLPRAGELLSGLLAQYRIMQDRHGEARTFGHLGMLANMQGNLGDAEKYAQQSQMIFEELGDEVNVAIGLFNLGNLKDDQAEFVQVEEYYRRALTQYRILERPDGQAATLNGLASTLRSLGRWEESAQLYRSSIAIYRDLDDLHDVATSLHNAAIIDQFQGK